MNKKSYVCSNCSKAFRRRWNAQRHNNDIHKGFSDINIKYKSGSRVDALKNKPDRYHSSFATASKFKKFKYVSQDNANESSFKSFNNSGFPIKKSNKPVVTMGEGEKDDFVDITTEKMGIHVEKLEKLFFEKLYPHEPHEKTKKKCYAT